LVVLDPSPSCSDTGDATAFQGMTSGIVRYPAASWLLKSGIVVFFKFWTDHYVIFLIDLPSWTLALNRQVRCPLIFEYLLILVCPSKPTSGYELKSLSFRLCCQHFDELAWLGNQARSRVCLCPPPVDSVFPRGNFTAGTGGSCGVRTFCPSAQLAIQASN